MKLHLQLLAFISILALAGCGREATPVSSRSLDNANAPGAQTSLAHGTQSERPGSPPFASAHGGESTESLESQRGLIDTSELDAKIRKAVEKAKANKATEAEKNAAAEAYLERANLYRDAGNPRLYKFALADYNSVLLYDPQNSEAKEKRDEIVNIYRQLGKPVPQLSNEN